MIEPKRLIRVIAVTVFGVFMIFYMYKQIIGIGEGTVETETALAVTVENTVSATGYLFRSEYVIDAASDTAILAVADDGERVSRYQTIANLYTSDADSRKRERLREIEKKLRLLKSSVVDQEFFTADITKLEKDKTATLQEMQKSKAMNNLADCAGRRDELLVELNKLCSVRTGETFDSEIGALQSERIGLIGSDTVQTVSHEPDGTGTDGDFVPAVQDVHAVTAPFAGYYYSTLDGYEKIYDPALLDSMTYADFVSMTEEEPLLSTANAGKIVTDSRWYAVCRLPKNESRSFEAGRTYTVIFPYSYDTTLRMELQRVISETDRSEDILIFSTNDIPSNFSFTRIQKLQIVGESFSGLRVPRIAIRILEDGTKGVYILVGETVRFRTVETIYENDDFCIVRYNDGSEEAENEKNAVAGKTAAEDPSPYREITLYDSVIIGGKDLQDGKKIG